MKSPSKHLSVILALAVFLTVFLNFCREGHIAAAPGGTGDTIILSSSDTELVSMFKWAVKRSLSYVGNDSDPVGPWYEAALPGREAFCMRDVSHQCIGAEILGLSKQNLNMFRKFVTNISEKKDYCSYWEINRYNKPAPVDYLSDDDFWYNLNANFDIIDACRRLYEWTGNTSYIFSPEFEHFFELTLNEYTERWQLQPDRIMTRPARMNLRKGTIRYRSARGIPSYDESQEDISVSGDLLAVICNGYRTYSEILQIKGEKAHADQYQRIAEKYSRLIDSLWGDEKTQTYHGFYKNDGKFYPGGSGQSEFLLWYNVISDPAKIRSSLSVLKNSQVEVLSYLPAIFYRYGYNSEAYEFLKLIYSDKRRDYPEASPGIVEGVVKGMMGIEPDANADRITTYPRLTKYNGWVEVRNVHLFPGVITVRHDGISKTRFANTSVKNVTWRAMFPGVHDSIRINGKAVKAVIIKDCTGNDFSYVDTDLGGKGVSQAEVIW